MQLRTAIKENLVSAPPARAIEFKNRWMTRGDAHAIIDAIDRHLSAEGLGEGTPVVVLARNLPSLAATIAGLVMTGRCVVPVTPFQNAQRIVEDIGELKAPAVIAVAADWEIPGLADAVAAFGGIGLRLDPAGTQVAAMPGLERLGTGKRQGPMPGIAVHMTTSGTTGRPKRVPITFQQMETNALSWLQLDAARNSDKPKDPDAHTIILHNPIVHISGMMFLVQAFFTGQQLCLIEKFNVPEWVDAVRRFHPAYPGLAPTAMRMVLDASVAKEDLASLIAVRVGTAPLDEKTRQRWEDAYGIPILTNYGATEFAAAVTQWKLDDYLRLGKSKPSSVGSPVPDVTLRIVDPDTGNELPVGEKGLLEVKATRFGPDADWLRTTDFASVDADGYLYIHGRADQAIIRGGFKVIPEVVAEVLAKHESIKDAAVVGIADERLGTVPVAAVECNPGAKVPSESELEAYLRRHLVSYQIPVKIVICEALPRTPSLKIDLRAVREMFTPA